MSSGCVLLKELLVINCGGLTRGRPLTLGVTPLSCPGMGATRSFRSYTIDALPEVVAVADGKIPVLLDGGIRCRTDVLKKVAQEGLRWGHGCLGGRTHLWGLIPSGAAGVNHALTLLRDELHLAMTISGWNSFRDVDRDCVRATNYHVKRSVSPGSG